MIRPVVVLTRSILRGVCRERSRLAGAGGLHTRSHHILSVRMTRPSTDVHGDLELLHAVEDFFPRELRRDPLLPQLALELGVEAGPQPELVPFFVPGDLSHQ